MVAIHDIPDSRPFQKVLTRLSNKWNVLVIRRLAKKTMRHSQLKRDIGNISQKMLTQTLRELERSGLIERKVYPVIPPKVEY
ncbi:MAG: helix-turn-helix transcriptional regulator, partial [Rhodospirillaceae bacterium]|nr:helix-turn-helix transcriptional regulator [Rhodospirillaceae bacterium]